MRTKLILPQSYTEFCPRLHRVFIWKCPVLSHFVLYFFYFGLPLRNYNWFVRSYNIANIEYLSQNVLFCLILSYWCPLGGDKRWQVFVLKEKPPNPTSTSSVQALWKRGLLIPVTTDTARHILTKNMRDKNKVDGMI